MIFVVAVDPGDRHVGVATWAPGSKRRAYELDAEVALERLDGLLRRMVDKVLVRLVLEEFRLYAHTAQTMAWSTLETAQMVGAIKWIAAKHGVEVTEQKALILKPTRAQMKARNIESVGEGPHARDAETHLVYYVLKEGLAK